MSAIGNKQPEAKNLTYSVNPVNFLSYLIIKDEIWIEKRDLESNLLVFF